ncbi:MAG: efflux RND transporter periplasmic adaptor subunit, partial [bacterium]
RPVIAVNGSTPFWRELSRGASGTDVAELQRLLREAGYQLEDLDGRFGLATEHALRAFQTDFGYAQVDGVLQLNDLMIAPWPARVGAVSPELGSFIETGTELLVLTADQPGVQLELLPSDRLRVTAGDEADIEVTASGQQADGFLASVSDNPVVRDDGSVIYEGYVETNAPLETSAGAQVRVAIVTVESTDVLAIPIASVVTDQEGRPSVRVVNSSGRLQTVPIELGVTEGAFVEVKAGLDGSERVVVAEDR